MRCTQRLTGDGATEVAPLDADGFVVLGTDREVDEVGAVLCGAAEVGLAFEEAAGVLPPPLLAAPEEQPATTNAETAQAVTACRTCRDAATDRP